MPSFPAPRQDAKLTPQDLFTLDVKLSTPGCRCAPYDAELLPAIPLPCQIATPYKNFTVLL